jgi:hypothetical protein
VLATENVKEFHHLKVVRLGLLDRREDCFVSDRFGHDHRHIALDRRERCQGLEAPG